MTTARELIASRSLNNMPSKKQMAWCGVFNTMSKIYYRTDDQQFETVEQAKEYFFTPIAMKTYNLACNTEFVLTEDKRGLHWTIDFGMPEDHTETPYAEQWRIAKDRLTDLEAWFVHPPEIDHSAPDLFNYES